MISKKEQCLKNAKNMIEVLREKIPNSRLLSLYCGGLDVAYNINNLIIIKCDENYIHVKNKIDKDEFLIEILPNLETIETIKTNIVRWNCQSNVNTLLKLSNDTINFEEIELNKYRTTDKIDSSIQKNKKALTWKNNKLIHSYNFASEISLNGELDSETECEEILADGNHAIKIVTNITENMDTVFSNNQRYYETFEFEEPPFNDINSEKSVYCYGMTSITKEEYDKVHKLLKSK